MISIIICSRTANINDALMENIKATVGCVYELVIIDNSKNTYSIFEAYNLGISKSKFDYWCFIHDDITFKTNDWGNAIHTIFKSNNAIGLIGVAGAKYKSKMPSAWWSCDDKDRITYLIQHFKDKPKEFWNVGFTKENTTEDVVAIDGVFMAAKKDERIRFNTTLKGFHNYDLNLALEYKKLGYDIVVTNKLLIEHFSLGTLNASWYTSTAKLHELYKNTLPLAIKDELQFNKSIEFQNGAKYLKSIAKQGVDKYVLSLWLKLFWLKPLAKFHFKFLKQLVF
ncbi:glycosyltransferase [Pontimicrobium sp. IMCC45349]|uniref:glycosyltransferase n=1 Tax=Pontimicrobium sp. IMCC45349 TaxID=3391574 RepID=UPI0039A14005